MSQSSRDVSWQLRILLALIGGLGAACGSNQSSEKVDAGQRRYCDAYCADAQIRDSQTLDGERRVLEAGGGVDSGGRGPDTSPDAGGGRPEVSSFDTPVSAVDTIGADTGSPALDSSVSDVRSETGGAGGGGGGSSGGAGGSSGGAGGNTSADASLKLDSADAPLSLDSADASQDATDAPRDVVDSQSGLDGAPAGDVPPEVGDAPTDVTDVPPSDLADVATNLQDGPIDQSSPAACQAAQVATEWQPQIWPDAISGLAYGFDGSLWAAGDFTKAFTITTPTGTTTAAYTGTPVGTNGAGDHDVYLVKLDPVTGLATVAKFFGQQTPANANEQTAAGVAVASDGSVGLIGAYVSEIDFTAGKAASANKSKGIVKGTVNLDYLTTVSASSNFVVTLDATGASKAAWDVDLNGGSLFSVASNPSQAALAICGVTNGQVAGNLGDSVTEVAVATPGKDIVVAKIDAATGAILWAHELGAEGDQLCQSVAMDSNGDVIIAGGYNGTLQFGTLTAFPVVSDTNATLLYVAKLASSDGTPLSAATWGTAGKTVPFGLTVDGNHNIVLAGSVNTSFTMGSFPITVSNSPFTTALVAKLDTSLVPQWANAFGDDGFNHQAKSVAAGPTGDIYVSGLFIGSMGAMSLTSYSNSNSDAFVAHLGADGSVICAHVLGDSGGAQFGVSVALAPAAAGSAAGSVILAGGFANTLLFDHPGTGVTPILTTGSPSVSSSYILRLAP